jgi:histidinol-phosphate aminotransferase
VSADHGRVVTTNMSTSDDRTVEVHDQDAAPAGAPKPAVAPPAVPRPPATSIRAGYLLAPPQTANLLRAARQLWSINSLACAALAAWADHGADHAAHRAQRLAASRERLAAALETLPGVRIWPSAANFLLLRVADGPAVLSALAARGIAVRPCHSFPGLTTNHLRVAVRDPADNQLLVNALAETQDAASPDGG